MKTLQNFLGVLLFTLGAINLSSCSEKNDVPVPPAPTPVAWASVTASPDTWDNQKRGNISYQALVYSFADADGDKYGDLRGLTEKLDYLDALGVQAVWLSPIHPSPSYHGYDVKDYDAIDTRFGTMNDFKTLVAEAKKRGIRIYLDYVLNHTSTEHPWFKEGAVSATSPYRQYYSFSNDPKKDIADGKIDMIATQGASGYVANEWYVYTGSNSTVKGKLKFVLDWSNAASPTVTVTETTTVDADNPDTGTSGAKYLYFGNGTIKKFYDKGNNKYELSVDFSSDWGFLIRTSNSTWDGGTKYGASAGQKLTMGQPFTLTNQDPQNIVFSTMNMTYYHSGFWTSSFADLNYGKVSNVTASPAFQAVVASAKGWIDSGVDGFRLDAVKHIYHNETSDENPRFLRAFYDALNPYYKSKGNTNNLYMVGEVLSEHNVVAPYYAGLPAYFEFSFWYRLEWAINNGQGFAFAKDIVGYRQEYAARRADYIAATKLTNHDEDRAASKLGRDAGKLRLAAAVLLTSSGEPYIYYGEELGLYGVKNNGDEWVRSSMPWGDKYTTDLTSTYGDKIDRAMLASTSVAKQEADTQSLLHAYRTFTRLRNTYPALAEGTMEQHGVYNESNTAYRQLAVWYMTKGTERMLVLHNFGSTTIELPLTDTVQKAVAVQGTVESKTVEGKQYVRLGKYSTVVYKM